jgi:hypothetical protein
MNRLVASCALALVCAAPAAAQDTPFIAGSGSRPVVNTDGTYVFNHIPNSNLVFEAQIAPRIIIYDSIGDAAQKVLGESKPAVWGWQASATPMVRLRMFNETSNPVRTPSYMPKGTVQFMRLRNLSRSNDRDEEEFNRGPIETLLIDAIPFGHHSNGQNGCLFTTQFRDAEGECVNPVPVLPENVNKEDGSFSTNYLQVMAYYGRLSLDSTGAPDGEFATRREWRIGAGIQLNPQGYVGGSIDEELSDIYGPTRVLFEAAAAQRDVWRCGRAEGSFKLQFIGDAAPDVPSFITAIEGLCLPRRWGGAGLFVRYYYGQDYYNLAFNEGVSRLQFGFALQKDSFLSFRIAP